MKSLYIANGDRLEVDWSLVEALTSVLFVTKVLTELKSDLINEVFSAKNYNGSVEIILRASHGFVIFQYENEEIHYIALTDSDITEMYQNM